MLVGDQQAVHVLSKHKKHTSINGLYTNLQSNHIT